MLVKSPVQTVSNLNGQLTFRDFIDREGPNGGRMVIDGIWLHGKFTGTVAGATLPGEDLVRMFGAVQVLQVDGVRRWNLGADACRIMAYALQGADQVQETADQAAGAVTPQFGLYLPLLKERVHSPEDLSMPVDWFDKVLLTLQGSADAHPNGGTLSVFTSLDLWVVAEVREEMDVQIKCVDEIRVDDFTTTGTCQLNIGGKLHDLYLHARGASGGASQATMNDARIDLLGIVPITKQELVAAYRRNHRAANNLNSTHAAEVHADPVAAGIAVPVVMSEGATFYDGRVLKTATLNLTSTVASNRAISRVLVPATSHVRSLTGSLYNLSPSDFRVKTRGKSRQAITDWPAHVRPFAPLKAPMRRRA